MLDLQAPLYALQPFVLVQNFNLRHRVNFIPAIVTVGNVGSSHPHTIPNTRYRDLRTKSLAGSLVLCVGRRMFADDLHYKLAVSMYQVNQV